MNTTFNDDTDQEKQLVKALENDLKGLSLPKDKVQKIVSLVIEKKYIFSSGLIPPEILQHIEELFPGYGQKFLDSYFAEIIHRRDLEMKEFLLKQNAQENTDKKDFKDIHTQRVGMVSAFFIVIVIVISGSYLFFIDKIEGGISIIGAISVIIAIFMLKNKRGSGLSTQPSNSNNKKGKTK